MNIASLTKLAYSIFLIETITIIDEQDYMNMKTYENNTITNFILEIKF